tara:strand:+ start:514 stop:693 length:180 start_codon:yes stop_codon:yes gene_type:complete
MKLIIKYVGVLVTVLIIFGMFSFYALTFDFGEWTEETRVVFLLIVAWFASPVWFLGLAE